MAEIRFLGYLKCLKGKIHQQDERELIEVEKNVVTFEKN